MQYDFSRNRMGNCQPLTVDRKHPLTAPTRFAHIVFLILAGCDANMGGLKPPDIDASAVGAAAIELYDTDGNTALDESELDQLPAIKTALRKYDTDGDGQITADEIEARVQSWQVVPTAAMTLSCTVRYRGRPLKNATVVLEPEPFLQEHVYPAIGKTDENGFAQFAMATNADPAAPTAGGVQCGLYKVRITAPIGGGRNLPSKYNDETQLGLEVAPDATFARDGLRFDL